MSRLAVLVCLLAAPLLLSLQAAETSATASAIVPPKVPVPTFPDRSLSVTDFGATGKGQVNDTPAINKAIAACNAAGGGTVNFPAGSYLAASIHLKSNVRFVLDKGAVITGAKEGFDPPEPNAFDKYQDFGHSHFHNALFWGENLENVAITGGTINGGGIITGDPKPGGGDKLIAIRTGKNLSFENIVHETGGHFVYLLNDCENVTLAHLTVKRSRDAVDLMSCRNVVMHDCTFTGCGDDTLGIKSDYALGRKIASANIYTWDCYFETGCNAVQFGSETAGDFSNIKAWNIRIGRAEKAGIGITCNDGAIIDGVEFRDFVMKKASTPIFMLITDRLRTGEKDARPGRIKNVRIANVTASEVVPSRQGSPHPVTLSGLPAARLEGITLENIKITYQGGGTREQAEAVPPYTKSFPPRVLGTRPASGLFARHATGLALRHVEFRFEAEDFRPALVLWDIDGLELVDVRAQRAAGVDTLRLQGVKKLRVQDCPGLADEKTDTVEKGKR